MNMPQVRGWDSVVKMQTEGDGLSAQSEGFDREA